ncbi:MAG: energy-coupling factor transporter transmembrane component T family protein [Candidatus Bathyarchaeia archaeon]
MFRGFEYLEKDTFFHRVHAIPKIWLALVIATLSIISRNLITVIALFLFLIVILWSSEVLRNWLITMKSILILWLLIIALNVVYYDVFWGIFVGLKFGVLLTSFSVLFQVTSIDDFADALIKLHVPPLFAFLLSTSFQFIPTLAEEDMRMTEALKARCLDLEAKSIIERIKNNIPRFILLFISGTKRALQIAEAMECRAFGAKVSVRRPTVPMVKKDKAIIVATTLTFALMLLLRYHFGFDI